MQPLAAWQPPTTLAGVFTDINDTLTTDGAITAVQNKDFRDWRAKHQRGGDFMVLSDVRRVRLPFTQKISW